MREYTNLSRVVTNSRLKPPDALLQISNCLMAGTPQKEADYRAAINAYLWLGRNASLAPVQIDTLRARVIGYFAQTTAIPALIDYLDRAPFPDGGIIQAAGRHPEALPILLRLALSREPETAWYTLRVVSTNPDPKVFEMFVTALQDSHLYQSWATAVEGLLAWPGRVQPLPKPVVTLLVGLLSRTQVGCNAAGVLARYGATDALNDLQLYALDGMDDVTRRATIRAVLALGGAEILIDDILRLITGEAPTRAEKAKSNLAYLATLEPVRLAFRFFVPGTAEPQRRALIEVLKQADLGGLTDDDLGLLQMACETEPADAPMGELARVLWARIKACNPPAEGEDVPDKPTEPLEEPGNPPESS